MCKVFKLILFLTIAVFVSYNLHSQSKLSLNGYVSNMGQYTSATSVDPMFDYILHNRVNIAYYVNDNFTIHTQFRNQFMLGNSIALYPDYAKEMEKDRGFFDMSFNWWANSNNVMNTQFDRAYIEYVKGNFEISAGRQRVNWGRTLVWNPNDIFNAFSYYDFDYPERPGSDAIRTKYYLGTASSAEVVAKLDSGMRTTVAGLYKFNTRSYDIQFMGGYVNDEDIVIGAGWEGNIKLVAFRGEASYYHPIESFADSSGAFLSSLSFDYLINDKLTSQVEFLYNDKKTLQGLDNSFLMFSAPPSSKSLSFSEYNIFGGLMCQVSPIITANLSAMYYTDYAGFFLMPSFEISATENLYFTMMYYYFNMDVSGSRTAMNMVFGRLKWNF